ncbi:tetratricopeptide repeat protein [Rubellicoccus peritrichatus]|uniref:Tetratricopeptide repeat protein n=1 Tax=Rubellicoccus peritrichatus TaxID=3080537 RepID=A0AAQ3LCN3_9BACT|nr:tetratricopeptide repeat protein [Puniceicoccus sp. CR14]WOO42022.1 hypothetical protein RZN69_02905 [Puniceicoccus sp. CR14]
MLGTNKLVKVCLILAFSAGLIVSGVFIWRHQALANRNKQISEEIPTLVEINNFVGARRLAELLDDPQERHLAKAQINQSELSYAVNQRNAVSIERLLGDVNGLTDERKDAAQRVMARSYIHQKRESDLIPLLEANKDKPHWTLIEADWHITQGNTIEAVEILESQTFSGKNESYRLARLAALKSRTPEQAIAALEAALEETPRSSDILSFRGQILEAIGAYPEAQIDYVNAVINSPHNLLYWDQLGEYYIRRQNYSGAIQIWIDAIEQTGEHVFWLKAWFWNRVTVKVDNLPEVPAGNYPLHAFLVYCDKLPESIFWDAEAYMTVPGAKALERTRPEVQWLSVLQLLADGEKAKAINQFNIHAKTIGRWAPQLRAMLLAILMTQRDGHLPTNLDEVKRYANQHQFFEAIAKNQDPTLIDFLITDASITAALLASGWTEAALVFSDADQTIANRTPKWLNYAYAQALRINRSNQVAKDWLTTHTNTSADRLLLAELQLGDGQIGNAMKALINLSKEENEIGARATMLLCLAELELGNPDNALAYLRSNKSLAQSNAGILMLERLNDAKRDAE